MGGGSQFISGCALFCLPQVDATMLVVLVGIVILHLTEIIILIISTSVNVSLTFFLVFSVAPSQPDLVG